MNYIIDLLNSIGIEVYLGLSESDKFEDRANFVVSRALGRTFCTKNKIAVLLSYYGFIESLPNLMNVGILGRTNFYLIVSAPKVTIKDHVKLKSLAYGLGFSVFKFTTSFNDKDVERSLMEILPKLSGPICIFIEEDGSDG